MDTHLQFFPDAPGPRPLAHVHPLRPVRTTAPPVPTTTAALAPTPDVAAAAPRPIVRGPFLFVGEQKFVVKAVTYGTFAPDGNGDLFPPRATVRTDFAAMRRAHVNTIRTYTAPPIWLLEEARDAGLRVLVGIHWEAHNCRYEDRRCLAEATAAVREAVRRCQAFPDVVLAYVVGNEIPPLIVRFYGPRRIRRFLGALVAAARTEDPGALVTYGNFPSTEYLALDCVDFQTVNVYLRDPVAFGNYLDRLLLEANGKPLLLGEVGDDSMHQGLEFQRELLDWTIATALEKGCCGVTVFSWTDDWVVAGHPIERWTFGLVDRQRRPKPALAAVARHYAAGPVGAGRLATSDPDADHVPRAGADPRRWPRVSVVVCNYNGGETIDETLESLRTLDYPDFEVIVVEDGSTDDSLAIAQRHRDHVRLITHENHQNLGLSVSRNVGAQLATGQIVAYIDSDAYADPQWLRHLVLTLTSGDYAGVGGPNLTPPADGLLAQFIAMCPGNPTHVLIDNVRADHVPGVNMAYWRHRLLGCGGFDPVHRAAGDDVDLCWRLRDQGLEIAFSPAAIVWHHRRPSLRRYFKQQAGYGVAEDQLERKHPDRFTPRGRIRWEGRVYCAQRRPWSFLRPFVYHGFLGGGFFQTVYTKPGSSFHGEPGSIEFYVLWLVLLALAPLWPWLLLLAVPLMALSVGHALLAGWTAPTPFALTPAQNRQKFLVVAWAHFAHPFVRAWGRLRARLRGRATLRPSRRALPLGNVLGEVVDAALAPARTRHYWGVGPDQRLDALRAMQRELRTQGIGTVFGTDWDQHDLSLLGGPVTSARIHTSLEYYDRALCVAVTVGTSSAALATLLGCSAALLWLVAIEPAAWPLFVAPPIVAICWLANRSRLRRAAWQAVDRAMALHGGTRFDDRRDPSPVPAGAPARQ